MNKSQSVPSLVFPELNMTSTGQFLQEPPQNEEECKAEQWASVPQKLIVLKKQLLKTKIKRLAAAAAQSSNKKDKSKSPANRFDHDKPKQTQFKKPLLMKNGRTRIKRNWDISVDVAAQISNDKSSAFNLPGQIRKTESISDKETKKLSLRTNSMITEDEDVFH